MAGGEGKRLQSLALGVPKPLIMIKGKPLLNYNLGLFAKYGVTEVKIVIRPSDREEYDRWHEKYRSEFPKTKIDLVEESEPMGTFGYIFHHLRQWMDGEEVFVSNGDDIKDIDLAAMLAFHRRTGAPATLTLMEMEKPDDYGAVLVRGDRVSDFLEKKAGLPAGLVNAGLYVITPAALDHFATSRQNAEKFLMFEKDFFPALAAKGLLAAFVSAGTFYDCGTPERWERAKREL